MPQTVVIDKNGQVVKVVGKGRFRDSYGRSVLQVGESLFGLYYTADINLSDDPVKLSEEYIYDARYIYDGKIAYIIKSPEVEQNLFLFCISDQQGKLLKQIEVTGSCLVLSPDGKSVFIKGERDEEIDLTSMVVKQIANNETPNYTQEAIYRVIREAVDSCCKFDLTGAADMTAVNKYFTDTQNPDQWANFVISNYMKQMSPTKNAKHYVVDIRVGDLQIIGDTASVNVVFGGSNSFGTGYGDNWRAELIKINNRWYITGLSTFPDSSEYQKVKQYVEKLITNAQSGGILQDELQDKKSKHRTNTILAVEQAAPGREC